MRVIGRRVGSVVVVSMGEPVEIDMANVESFRAAVIEAIGDAPLAVLDCSSIPFFDSAGLGGLLSIQKRLGERGGRVVLTGANRAVHEVFRMVGFDLLLRCYPDVPQALEALGVSEA